MLPRRVWERRRAAASLVAISLVAALAGCGGDENASTSTAASTSEEVRPASGEESIETFGSEASGGERAAIVAAFEGYLKAVATREPATACSHLSASVQRSLERFASPSLKRKGCSAILPQVLAPEAAAIARQEASGKITRVRVEGDRGFVIFHAPGAKLYQMPMVREDGEWKVGLVASAVLVPQL